MISTGMKRAKLVFPVLMIFLLAGSLQARIKLATLPERNRVEVMLDNGKYTLVEEERVVPLLKTTRSRGNNRVDFSWSNTMIDKNSIQFRPLAIRRGGRFVPIRKVTLPGGRMIRQVQVVSVSYPPGENALVWDVFAARACAVKVRVSYLIRNLGRVFSYRALANRDESRLTLRKFISVSNYSGEDFGLAGIWAGFGDVFRKVLGQQETLKILVHKFRNVPIEKTYTFDWYKHGRLNAAKPLASRVLMHYVLQNDKKHGMGRFPLQPGKVRIFMEDSSGSSAFLGEDWARLTPVDDRMKLYLGDARDIVCTRKIVRNRRHHLRGDRYNQELILRYEIQNFKKKAATLRIVEQMYRLASEYASIRYAGVEWSRRSGTSSNVRISTKKGSDNPVLSVKLPARPKDAAASVPKIVVKFHVMIKNLW